ncbi:uncharacterized protein LOC121377114 [Gigantopelta aegis]|uniref:uncharacterized protein LOC121377114 n=1 Tax=Gigantopelta aegis TaxID=1735272 RepID=UPI001B88AB9A|nr:uncharacterized protein LOC121377114 [Gigantopelta aegis]
MCSSSVVKQSQHTACSLLAGLPLQGALIDCISVHDMSKCVLSVLLRQRYFLFKTIGLTVEKLTAEDIASTFQKYLSDKTFIASDIRVKDYEDFRFPGSKELAHMFGFYITTHVTREKDLTRQLCGFPVTFDRWVNENKTKIDCILINRFSKMSITRFKDCPSVTSSFEMTATSEQKTTACEQKNTACEQKTTSSEQKATSCEQKATVCEQKATVCEQKATVCEQKTTACEQKTSACEQKATSCEKKNTACEQKTTSSEQKATSCEKKTTSCEKKTTVCEQKGN